MRTGFLVPGLLLAASVLHCSGSKQNDDNGGESSGKGGASGRGGGTSDAAGGAGDTGMSGAGADNATTGGTHAAGGTNSAGGAHSAGGTHSAGGSGNTDAGAANDAGVPGSSGEMGTGGSSTMGGAGGSSATGGSGDVSGAAGVDDNAGMGGGTASCGNLIDDMESDDGNICRGSGRMGYWYTYIDSVSGSSISPGVKPALPSATSPARTNSQWAMWASGTFHTYAGVGCVLDAVLGSAPHAYDASGFTGLHFWAHGTAGMKVVLQATGDELTTNGGTCTDSSSCHGSEYALAGLSSTAWTEYRVPFTSVTGGTVALQPSDLWSVEFSPITPGPFEMWVDDLNFY